MPERSREQLGGRRRPWLVVSSLLCTAVAIDGAIAAPECVGGTLRQAADQAGVLVGAAAGSGSIANDALYAETLAAEFSSLTAEGEMKWDHLQREPGVWNFAGADALMAFAEANEMAVRGHTLVWNQRFVDSTPDWVEELTDPTTLRAAMAEHIGMVVGRYAGRVDSWDVVNEPLKTGRSVIWENHFYDVLGIDYIAEAFVLAHAADPSALLFLNEVGISTANARFDAFYQLVVELLEQDVPIHGVGFQGHFFTGVTDPAALEQNLRAFSDLGLVVEITELDIPLVTPDETPENLAIQAQDYANVVSACLAVERCTRVTMWGLTDRHSWINGFLGDGFEPLLLDEEYQPKPAYESFRSTLLVPEPAAPVLRIAGLFVVALMVRRPRSTRPLRL